MAPRTRRGVSVLHILSQYGERAAEAAREALQENAEALINEARSRVPVRTGRLKESIHAEPYSNGNKIRVVADAEDEHGTPYAAIVEYSPKINKPFLFPSFYALRTEMINRVKEKVRAELRGNV